MNLSNGSILSFCDILQIVPVFRTLLQKVLQTMLQSMLQTVFITVKQRITSAPVGLFMIMTHLPLWKTRVQ